MKEAVNKITASDLCQVVRRRAGLSRATRPECALRCYLTATFVPFTM